MYDRHVIVIGASAGGVEAVMQVVSDLPASLPAAVFVVIHVPPDVPSTLPLILSRAGSLPASHARDGQPIEPGRIYVAPPDHHLLLGNGVMRVVNGPRENRSRPSIDPLFRSAAQVYGERVTGVILTGTLDDGTAGLAIVKQQGGVAIVQDPADALFPDMPRNALANVEADWVLPADEIAAALVKTVHASVAEREQAAMDDAQHEIEHSVRIAEMDAAAIANDRRPGTPSSFGCPECGGVLWEQDGDHPLRFRCRVGHAYSAESLLAAQAEGYEVALWTALRALEEKRALTERLIERSRSHGMPNVAQRFEEERASTLHAVDLIRELLSSGRSESERVPTHTTLAQAARSR